MRRRAPGAVRASSACSDGSGSTSPHDIIHALAWGYSSAGRALAWHARGHRFDPGYLHQTGLRLRQKVLRSPSSRGLGHRPFTAVTGVRIPLGTPIKSSRYAITAHRVTRPV